ncbi:hypothetical protein D9M68_858340 [compost metagenome]
MRNQPVIIGSIACQSASHLVIYTSIQKGIETKQRLVQRCFIICEKVIVQQKLDRHSLRKFRCGTKASALHICLPHYVAKHCIEMLLRVFCFRSHSGFRKA